MYVCMYVCMYMSEYRNLLFSRKKRQENKIEWRIPKLVKSWLTKDENYVCMYVCMNVWMYVCISIVYIRLQGEWSGNMYVWWIRVCVNGVVDECVHVCMYVFMCIYMMGGIKEFSYFPPLLLPAAPSSSSPSSSSSSSSAIFSSAY